MHPPEIAAMVRIAPSLGLAVLLAACTPSAPDKEQPPEPQATAGQPAATASRAVASGNRTPHARRPAA